MQKIFMLVGAVALISSGYFYRAYTEKPKIVEVPKERVITRKQYVDRVTKQVITVETESTKFDPDAAVQIAQKPKSTLISVAYGIDKDSLLAPVYGIQVQQRVFSSLYVGVSGYTNGSIFATLGWQF